MTEGGAEIHSSLPDVVVLVVIYGVVAVDGDDGPIVRESVFASKTPLAPQRSGLLHAPSSAIYLGWILETESLFSLNQKRVTIITTTALVKTAPKSIKLLKLYSRAA